MSGGLFSPSRSGRSLRVAVVLALAGCGDGVVAPPAPAPPVQPPVSSRLEIGGPSHATIHQPVLYQASVRTGGGSPVPAAANWTVGDSTLARVNNGVLYPLERGEVVLTARVGGLEAAIIVSLDARIIVGPEHGIPAQGRWTLSVMDTLPLRATPADFDGIPTGEAAVVAWTSTDPSVATVSNAGTVTALTPGVAQIRATTSRNEQGFIDITVVTGGAATVRIAHAAAGLGPVTVALSDASEVTLAFGEAVVRQVPAATFMALAAGLPAPQYAGFRQFRTVLAPGNRLTVYIIGGKEQAFLTGAWSDDAPVSPDSVRFRLVQGWNSFGVVDVTSPGGVPDGLPVWCYLDPTDVTAMVTLGARPFELILRTKYGAAAVERIAVNAAAGRSTTLVLTGGRPGEMGVLAFPDSFP